ncbi:hypothetical protein A2U01_0055721, partial [Trifolium medium]|nr:hypothetical protein [Trifolium medium]
MFCNDSCNVFNSAAATASLPSFATTSSTSSSPLLPSHNLMCLNLHMCSLFHLSPHLKHSPFLLLAFDAYGWLVRVERYFRLNEVRMQDKVDTVVLAMEEKA